LAVELAVPVEKTRLALQASPRFAPLIGLVGTGTVPRAALRGRSGGETLYQALAAELEVGVPCLK
jgi:hypothetical protein